VSRRPFFAAVLTAILPLLASGQQTESEFYAQPRTAPEFWRAARFEIRTGNYERAAERIKGLLDLNPDDKTLFDLVDKPMPGAESGMGQFLRLRNVPRWNNREALDKEAKQRVEELINRISKAVQAELSNPDRIRRYANALAASPEEAAFALNELRRSGKAVPPVLAAILGEGPPVEVRSAILRTIPLLGVDTVPGFVAYLPHADANTQADLIDSLRRRTDYRQLTITADSDPVPTLWYLSGKADSPESVKVRAREGIAAAIVRDPAAERDPELRTPHGQLTDFARKFLEGTSNLQRLAGDTRGESAHNVWVWDGKGVKEVAMTRAEATEHYGLKYARWALNLQPDHARAQQVFLALAIEYHAIRAGGGRHLSRTNPELHAALATAPFELLADLLEEAMRTKKTAVVLAAVRVLGERTEPRASRPPGKGERVPPGRDRPALLVKALDYPDPRVQFTAADALLRVPGPPTHGRNAQIVRILAAAVAGDPPAEGAKQKVLLADPDPVRADAVSDIIQRAGFDAEVVRTGRQLIRRLQEKGDIDLVIVDRHITEPMLPDLIPQIRADYRARNRPLMVVASPDGVAPVNLITALARLAVVVAFEDLRDNPFQDFRANQADEVDRVQHSPEDIRRLVLGRHAAQVYRMRQAVERAGFTMTEEMANRIEYFSIQTFSSEILNAFVKQLQDHERILLRRLVPPLVLSDAPDAAATVLRSRIRTDELPSRDEAVRIVKLMRITGDYEAELPAERRAAFTKLWDTFWNPEDPRVPQMTPVRDPDVEVRVNRIVAPYRGVNVIPAIFTEGGFRDAVTQAVDPAAPLTSPDERRANAKLAMTWLRKMAVGEVPGYKVADAEPAIRSALRSDELAPLAIDALVRLSSKEAQLDLANLAVAPERPVEIRTKAASGLVEHIQSFGRFITGPQADAITNAAVAAEDPDLRSRLLAAQGVLKTDARTTGDRLKSYVPKPPEPKAEPPKKDEPKDEGKVDEKKD
jgi:CheY-like chemotaxis protein